MYSTERRQPRGEGGGGRRMDDHERRRSLDRHLAALGRLRRSTRAPRWLGRSHRRSGGLGPPSSNARRRPLVRALAPSLVKRRSPVATLVRNTIGKHVYIYRTARRVN